MQQLDIEASSEHDLSKERWICQDSQLKQLSLSLSHLRHDGSVSGRREVFQPSACSHVIWVSLTQGMHCSCYHLWVM